MAYTIEYSAVFSDSMMRAATMSAGHFNMVDLSIAVAKFVEWKRSGGNGRGIFTGDKWSGDRPDGTEFKPYKSDCYRHCHLDLYGTEPLLAYRQFEKNQHVYMVCITSHKEIFNKNEPAFYAKHKSLGRGKII